jgi:hypothetical protein
MSPITRNTCCNCGAQWCTVFPMAQEKLTEQIKIRVYPGMKRALKRLAAERDRKDSELARQAIENLLAAARDKKAA